MIEEAVQSVLDQFQKDTGIPFARRIYEREMLPDTYLVWFVVDAPNTAYANKVRAETFRIQVTLYTRDDVSADGLMRQIEDRFERAGFYLVGNIGESKFDTGHFSRKRDFRIRLKRRDFNA